MTARNLVNPNAAYESELIALLGAAFPLGDAVSAPPPMGAAVWKTLSETAQQNGLSGMFFRAIEILGRSDVPVEVHDAGQDKFRRSALAQALAFRELEAVMQECAQATLPVVVLKGAALAQTLYPERALRPFGDLDVLIHRADAARLRERLLARGLVEATVTYGFDPTIYGEMAFYPTRTRDTMLDLHWELVAPTYYRQRMDLGWFWRNTESFSLGEQTGLIFNPTAQFVHLAAHVGLHHQDNMRLVWLYDLALLMARRGNEIEWRAADAFARQAGLTRPLRAMLEATRARWGIALPSETEGLFQPSPFALGERAVYAVTTTRYTEARMLADALATPGLGNKLRFVRRHLVPDAAYMRSRYQIKNHALLPFYYVRRWGESGFKFVRSLGAAIVRK